MWIRPWGFKEGCLIGAGLLVTGWLLQITIGEIDWSLFAYPVNIIVLVLYIAGIVAMHCLRKRVYFFGWMSHYTSAVSSLLWVAGITVVMGLIRQLPSGHPADMLGFSRMLSAWPFVLLYIWMVTVLGLTTLRAGFPFRWKKLAFLLNHAGLFIALITATLGNADMQRLKMTTRIDNAEWRAMDEHGKLIELPLAIELKDFTIDEYPPKLMLIDNETGRTLPEKAPEHLLLEEACNGWATVRLAGDYPANDSLGGFCGYGRYGEVYRIPFDGSHICRLFAGYQSKDENCKGGLGKLR